MSIEPQSSDSNVDLAARGFKLRSSLQPIVTLPEMQVIGYEALARWPGTELTPATVFGHAAATGQLDRLDQLCMDAAINAATAAGLPPRAMLTINCEPATPYRPRVQHHTLDEAGAHLSLVFELTERHLLDHPAELLTKIHAIRADGFAIALDDVGAHPDSLTLLDVVSPDIVKLDLNLIQRRPRSEQARTMSAVLSYLERTDAVAVAEGIETDSHLEQALALGATLGQGYMFGYPQPATTVDVGQIAALPRTVTPSQPPTAVPSRCPFDVMTRDWAKPVRTARKEVLTALCQYIERQAADVVDPPMVLTVLQDERNLTITTRHRYEKLCRTSPLVAFYGRGLASEPLPGARGVALEGDDPLCKEWSVLTLGARTAAALIAREHAPQHTGRDADRLFDFVVTYDRPLVTAAARALLHRLR